MGQAKQDRNMMAWSAKTGISRHDFRDRRARADFAMI
jgi:hypothetical protein